MSLWSIGREPIERSEPGMAILSDHKANQICAISRHQRDERSGCPFLSPLSFGQAKERGKKMLLLFHDSGVQVCLTSEDATRSSDSKYSSLLLVNAILTMNTSLPLSWAGEKLFHVIDNN